MLNKFSTYKKVTLWYWAPELFLGIRSYSSKIDVWLVKGLGLANIKY